MGASLRRQFTQLLKWRCLHRWSRLLCELIRLATQESKLNFQSAPNARSDLFQWTPQANWQSLRRKKFNLVSGFLPGPPGRLPGEASRHHSALSELSARTTIRF